MLPDGKNVGHGCLPPLRTIDDVEYTTLEWIGWFNDRPHSRLDYPLPRSPSLPITLKMWRPAAPPTR